MLVPGTGSGDRVNARLEPGEFVVRKDAVKSNRGLLESINEGVPGYALGGMFGGGGNKKDSRIGGLASLGGKFLTNSSFGGVSGGWVNSLLPSQDR